MIGNDLIVAIPWMAFGLSLAAVCLRLCRFHRCPARLRLRQARQPAEDGHDSSANTREATGNDDYPPAASAPTQPWRAQPSQTQPSQTQSSQTQSSQTQQ